MNVKPVTQLDERILDLWRTGVSKVAIARATKASVLDVDRALQRGRYRRDPRAAARGLGPVRVARLSIPAALVGRLEAQARRRNMSPDVLAELLMVRIVDDSMVDAILDDGDET